MDETAIKWEIFLDPEIMRLKLVSISMFLTAFELLKLSIIGRIKTFYTDFPNGIAPEYKTEVLSLNKSPMYASLQWLQKEGAITSTDLECFESIKKARNFVAHEILNIVSGTTEPDFLNIFSNTTSLLRKIEVWWIVNFEIPINPDFDNIECNEEDIIPSPTILLKILIDIALGNEEISGSFLKQFEYLNLEQ